MRRRKLGRTGIEVSEIAFGCGNVGGLMIRGNSSDQERAVGHALDNGISYFDTAAQYGNGESEKNLGRALKALKANPTIATKLKISADQKHAIRDAMITSVDASLSRLGRETVDLMQLHNTITLDGRKDSLTPRIIIEEVVPVFLDLQKAGRIRFFGMTGMGDTQAILQIIDSGHFYTSQVVYNMLNPSAGRSIAPNYPAQDYHQLLARADKTEMGTVAIRIVAGGALRGPDAPHELASKSVSPMGSGGSFDRDYERGNRFLPLVENGHVASIPEAAVRFALTEARLSTVAVGLSDFTQLQATLAATAKGPLSGEALATIGEVQGSFVGEER
ncbi:MAG: hypothetical protein RLZ98_1815 [Pseudomonadota bacterium]|jgi:L-galactose dehydrogenase/L-glyceraldehyde 3-phosphate reductase